MLIRDTVTEDLPAILDIHNDAIRNTTAIWDETEVGLDERMAWLNGRLRAGNPVLTAVVDGHVAGYASYAQWRPKSGYRLTVEHSVYVAPGFHRRGVASGLLTELIERASIAGIHALVGVIESRNTTSIALHEKFGFVTVGQMPEVGIKFDRWLDLTLMQRTL